MRSIGKILITIIALVFYPAMIFANTLPKNGLFAACTDSLSKGKYAVALAGYQQLEHTTAPTAGLYNNIGYIYFKTRKPANSVWYFEKALLLSPLDTQIIRNKNIVSAQLGTGVASNNSGFDMDRSHFFTTTRALTQFMVFLMVISGTVLIIMQIGKHNKRKIMIRKTSGYLLAISLLVVLITKAAVQVHLSKKYAVVIAHTAPIRLGPSSVAKIDHDICEGYQIQIINEYEEWTEIKDHQDRSGWIYNAFIVKN